MERKTKKISTTFNTFEELFEAASNSIATENESTRICLLGLMAYEFVGDGLYLYFNNGIQLNTYKFEKETMTKTLNDAINANIHLKKTLMVHYGQH